MQIQSNQFSHKLKHGSLVEVPRPNFYNPEFKIQLIYLGRDALAFWGRSTQSGEIFSFKHQQINLVD